MESYKYAGVMNNPVGLLFHGSRSTISSRTIHQEFIGTAEYAKYNVKISDIGEIWHLGWHVTIGEYEYARHIPLNRYGWNAGMDGSNRIAFEFSQKNLGDHISDAQIKAACSYVYDYVRPKYPELYGLLLNSTKYTVVEHWEVPQGVRQGKTDTDPDHKGQLAERFFTELRKWHMMKNR